MSGGQRRCCPATNRCDRKTGLTVADPGIRDEHGLEPLDHLFSSPEKSTKKVNGRRRNVDETISSEEEMDIVESMQSRRNALMGRNTNMYQVRFPVLTLPELREGEGQL